MIEELKQIIEDEVKDELMDLRYKLKNKVPTDFIRHIQTKVHVLEWVKGIIEMLETKESSAKVLSEQGQEDTLAK